MAKFSNSKSASIVASTLGDAANSVATQVSVYTAPLGLIVFKHDVSAKGDRPKVLINSIGPNANTVGNVSIFAPAYLSFDEQRKHLQELFEHNFSEDGANLQDVGLYFERYGDGPTYEVISEKAAKQRMTVTGLNSAPIEFGTPNTKLTRDEIQTAGDLEKRNFGKAAVRSNKVGDILTNFFK